MKKIGVGVIGAGNISFYHVRGLQMVEVYGDYKADMVIIADSNLEAANSLGKRFGFQKITDDWREVINDPDVDVVTIVTPNCTHAEIAIAAAKAGKNVMIEKPMAMNPDEDRKIEEAFSESGVVNMVDFIYRTVPVNVEAKKLVEDGRIGEITAFRGWFDASYKADPEKELQWRDVKALAGTGVLGDVIAHVISLSDLITKSQLGGIVEVCADMDTVYKTRRDLEQNGKMVEIDTDDVCSVLIRYAEPTSSLSGKEADQLFKVVRDLQKKGIAVLFVSHKLEELFELCDRVTVMRDGEHIITEDITNMTNDKLISAMVGRTLDNLFPHQEPKPGEVALRAVNINSAGLLHDICIEAKRGEILSLFGLVGAGRTELFLSLFGVMPIDSGELYIDGKRVNNKTPSDAIKNKMALLTEDRKGQGLVLSQPVDTNLIMANISGFSKGIFLDDNKIKKAVEKNISELNIKTPSSKEVVSKLSGGNQQKVVVGKWANTDAEVYIFDEPTRGIDVGAKIEVYNVMNQLVQNNKCVIMISSELPEVLGMSDRVYVMRKGRIMSEITRGSEQFNQEDIMKAAWGGV